MPQGQARFDALGRADLLTMGYRGDGPLREQLRSKVAALRAAPVLHVLQAREGGRGESASGELRYLWTPEGGGTRVVDYRYQGDDVYEVAGPVADRRGLRTALKTAPSTGECSWPLTRRRVARVAASRRPGPRC